MACRGSSELTRVLFGSRNVFLKPRHEFDQIAGPVTVIQLPAQDVLPPILACARRAWKGKEVGAPGHAAQGTRLHR